MYMARVVGTVVSTQKESTVDGLRFMLLRQCDLQGNPDGGLVVAADAVGAEVVQLRQICVNAGLEQVAQRTRGEVPHWPLFRIVAPMAL